MNKIVETKEGVRVCFSRSGNGVWQAERGNLFFTVRVPESIRTHKPKLHTHDQCNPRHWIDGVIYLGLTPVI